MSVIKYIPILLALLLLCTCGYYRTIEVELYQGNDTGKIVRPETETRELLAEAGAILGYEIVPVRRAPIVLELVDSRQRIRGRAFRRDICRYFVRSSYTPEVIAHELGHVLNLGHNHNRGNLMHPYVTGTELSEAQRRKMKKEAKKLERLCYDNTEPYERRSAARPDVGGEPERLCPEPEVGQGQDAEQDLGSEQETTTGRDATESDGLREETGTSTGWPILFEWVRHRFAEEVDVRRGAKSGVRR